MNPYNYKGAARVILKIQVRSLSRTSSPATKCFLIFFSHCKFAWFLILLRQAYRNTCSTSPVVNYRTLRTNVENILSEVISSPHSSYNYYNFYIIFQQSHFYSVLAGVTLLCPKFPKFHRQGHLLDMIHV